MRRFLMITYAFPPIGGAGVQRPAKFAKYIGDYGWQPVVATVDHGSAPAQDSSLAADLPADLIIERLPTMEPGYGAVSAVASAGGGSSLSGMFKRLLENLIFPDRHILWLITAVKHGLQAAVRHGVEAVMVTAPPFSSFIMGAHIARKLNLPLILDFRDEWSGYYVHGFEPGKGSIWSGATKSLERRLVTQAAVVTAASPAYCHRFQEIYGGADEKYRWIPNGYDAEDFEDYLPLPVPREKGNLHLLYTGTVFPITSLDPLWRAMRLLPPGIRSHVFVEICGRVTGGEVVKPRIPGLRVEARGYMPHNQVIERMARADALLLTLADLPGSERVIPGKVFEYAAARKPILAICPPGVASVLAEGFGGVRVPPAKPQALAGVITKWLDEPPGLQENTPTQYERRHLTKLLADALDYAVDQRPRAAR